MGRTVHYLDSYPFEELKQRCKNYIYSIDWDKVSGGIDTDIVAWFDVSGCVGLFSRLRLAEDYRLICYMTSEHHANYLKKDYSRTKRCCLFSKSEICVAKEK